MPSGVVLTCHKYVKQFINGWEDRTSEVSPLNNHAMIHVLRYLSIIEQIKDRIEAVSLNFLQIFYVYSILHLFPSFNYSLYQGGLCQLFIINSLEMWKKTSPKLPRSSKRFSILETVKQPNVRVYSILSQMKKTAVVVTVQCDLIITDPHAGIPETVIRWHPKLFVDAS